MLIKLYQFVKRRNSTMIPTNSTTHLDISTAKINDGNTSILNPEVRLTRVDETGTLAYNYMYIPSFNRYYYIDNWQFNGDGTWTAYCRVDVLASWKPQIQSTGGYVDRASTVSEQNKYISDGMYPATNKSVTTVDRYLTGFDADVADGSFVIGVIGHNNPNIGAVSYYRVTAAQLQTLITNMATTSTAAWSSVNSFSSDVIKSLVNPVQFIVSCKWYPFAFSFTGETSENIYLWAWDTGATGYKLPQTWASFPASSGGWTTCTIYDLQGSPIPGETFPDYHHYPPYAPFAQYSFITPWGTFEIPTEQVAYQMMHTPDSGTPRCRLQYRIMMNFVSGTGTIEARIPSEYVSDAYYEVFRREIEVGMDIPLEQVSISYVNAAKGALKTVGGIASTVAGNPFGILNIADGIIDTAAAITSPSVQSTGATMAAFTPNIEHVYVQATRFRTVDQSNDTLGRPVKKYYSALTAFSGFIKMDVSEFRANCTESERDAVIEYLTNGVFLE